MLIDVTINNGHIFTIQLEQYNGHIYNSYNFKFQRSYFSDL